MLARGRTVVGSSPTGSIIQGSCQAVRHGVLTPIFGGSIPSFPAICTDSSVEEQLPFKQRVRSSSLLLYTICRNSSNRQSNCLVSRRLGVQIPFAAPYATIAQMAGAPRSYRGGQGFDSLLWLHSLFGISCATKDK